MRIGITLLSAVFLLGLLLGASNAGDEKKDIKPLHHVTGIIADKDKQKAAPKKGYLASEKAFDKLVMDWDLKVVPKIDFDKQIVFVQIAGGPNKISTRYQLDKDGNLTAKSVQTLKAGPGFGYGIDVLERQGIKTYQGKPIE